MKVLELFSGSKVLSQTFEKRGHDTFTVDKEEDYDPDLAVDILDLDVGDLPEEFQDADVVWASPPCKTFSTASLGHYWNNGKPSRHETYIGLAIVYKTVEVIHEISPEYWFVENPVGHLRKAPFLWDYRRATITYCQYGRDHQKPTDIWTNTDWTPREQCSKGEDCHTNVGRGVTNAHGSGGFKQAARLPVDLCDEIARYCEGEPVNNHKLTEQGLLRLTSSGGGGE